MREATGSALMLLPRSKRNEAGRRCMGLISELRSRPLTTAALISGLAWPPWIAALRAVRRA